MPVEITQSMPEVVVPPDPLIGTEVKETYRIVRKLGAGGMGTIYEVAHVHLPKRFALKVMLPEVAADKVSFERFRREAVTTSSLGNPHIAEVVDFNLLPDGSPYMVMEYLEGEDLSARLAKKGKLDTGQVASLIGNVASALTSAHAQSILHRDIKPANIFLAKRPDGSEVVKLLDFGAAKSKRANDLTAKGQVVGTPWYMSPEQARGLELDVRSDEFSLAVVAYEALCGRLPFDDEDPVKVLFRIVDEPPVPLHTYNRALPIEVGLVIEKALSKERGDRYATVEEFASHLTSALGGATLSFRVDAAMPLPPAKIAQPSAKAAATTITAPVKDHTAPITDPDGDAVEPAGQNKGGVGLVLGALGAVVLLGVGSFFIWGRDRGTPPVPAPVAAPHDPVAAAPAPKPAPAPDEEPPIPREGVAHPTPPVAAPTPAPAEPVVKATPHPATPHPVATPEPALHPVAERPAAERPAAERPAAAAPKAAVPLVTAPEAAPKGGWLTLDTSPWTQVYEGSRFLGDTPLAKVALSAGTHQLHLTNADQNVKQTVEVVIEPDKTTVTKLEF